MLKSGFRQALKGEYTFRAYINGKTDLTKAEAVKEIIDSHTDAGRSHAVGRLSGSLFEEIDSIKKLIIDTLASIEVEIEYPEDEETIADTFDRKDIELARDRLQTLADSWKGEKLYQDGARVVLAGRTNAGKSSLFNAILKEERAIVSDIEGTTRDWLESWASINGIPVRLFDTAGLR
ncbi:MAG: 50S ribosome-binding GTPase, partial [Fibrobacter sp.]|nr:50S ribosome-binding GTPase [Fibrobacter sp.]